MSEATAIPTEPQPLPNRHISLMFVLFHIDCFSTLNESTLKDYLMVVSKPVKARRTLVEAFVIDKEERFFIHVFW